MPPFAIAKSASPGAPKASGGVPPQGPGYAVRDGCWKPLGRQLGVAVLVGLLSASGGASEVVGRIVSVHDGDTVTLLDSTNTQYKVRLAGIDAPELGQAFGQRSKQGLARQVFGRTATIEWSKRDRYGRLVGKVLIEGRDANLAQVGDGLAWHYREYAGEQSAADRADYAQAEAKARASRRGLWQDPAPIPPWDFRHQKKARTAPPAH